MAICKKCELLIKGEYFVYGSKYTGVYCFDCGTEIAKENSWSAYELPEKIESEKTIRKYIDTQCNSSHA